MSDGENEKPTYSIEIEREVGTDKLLSEIWRDGDGEFHREDGPAIMSHDPKTGLTIHEFHTHGVAKHFDDGPFFVEFCPETGVTTDEKWFLHGSGLHRSSGPAWIERDRDTGEVIVERHFRYGKEYSPETGEYADDTLSTSSPPQP